MKATMLSQRSIGIAAGVLIVVCVACGAPPSATSPVAPASVTLAPNTPTAPPSPIASPTVSAVLRTVPFEVIAEGAPFVGRERGPILAAIRGDDPQRAIPDGLPDMAKEALQKVFVQSTPDLYIIIYAGGLGSTGFRVRINSATIHQPTTTKELLIIHHSLDKPQRGTPQLDVMTHPFMIVRVSNTNLRASDVVFEGQ